MIRKQNKIFISALSLLLGLTVLTAAVPLPAYASNYEERLAELKEEQEEATARREEAEAKLAAMKEEQTALIEEKIALEQRNVAAEQEIGFIVAAIAVYDEKIADKEKDVEMAEQAEEIQLARYRSRVRAMEEGSGFKLITLVLNADSFADLLSAVDDYGSVMNADKKLYNELQDARENHEQIEEEYRELKADCEEKQQELEAQKKALEEQIIASEVRILEMTQQIGEAEEEVAAMEQLEEEAAAATVKYIEDYKRAQAAAAAAAAAAAQAAQAQAQAQSQAAASQGQAQVEGGIVIDSSGEAAGIVIGAEIPSSSAQTPAQQTPVQQAPADNGTGFAWPFPGHTIITSKFGYRASTGSFHSGIDIDGYQSAGSPIVAAQAGTVIMASYNGAYGNCIVIDHGSYSTLYAHLNSMSVGVGASVAKGSTIGGVGNTGTCYGLDGVHLHFEVIVGGAQTDPLPYLSGYGYSFY